MGGQNESTSAALNQQLFAHSARSPSRCRLAALVKDLAARVEKGQTLYVHCWGGRGRAGMVGTALLAELYAMGADEALERVQRAFDTRQDEGRRSPETVEQRAFVRQFIEARATARV